MDSNGQNCSRRTGRAASGLRGEVVFGVPGDGVNGIMESLRKRRETIRFIATRHEEAAAFATVGYAQFSLERAAQVLNEGGKVAMLIGAGARGARPEIEQIAGTLGAPERA